MSKIEAPITGHPTYDPFSWALWLLAQPVDGADASPINGAHYKVSLTALRDLLVQAKDVTTAMDVDVAGKVADARAIKALSGLIDDITEAAGQPDGTATLDENGLLPPAQLPPLAIVRVWGDIVDEEAMLALAATQGDIAVRTDLGRTYVLATAPADVLSSWVELGVLYSVVEDLAGAGRTTETVKGNADAITGLAGAGRTDETVMDNAQAIIALGQDKVDRDEYPFEIIDGALCIVYYEEDEDE